jgi:hypothetical protein
MLSIAFGYCNGNRPLSTKASLLRRQRITARWQIGKRECACCVGLRLERISSARCFRLYRCVAHRLAGGAVESTAEDCAVARSFLRTRRGSLLRDSGHGRNADQDRDCGELVPKKAANSGIRPIPRLASTIHDQTDLTLLRILLGCLQAYPTPGKRLHVCWCRLP